MTSARIRRLALACGALIAACATLQSSSAHAQGTPITNNDFGIEYTQGPVFASNRVVGLSGASSAISESVEGLYSNPASPAVRSFRSDSWFDWALDGGISFAGAYADTDYENRGKLGISRGEKLYSGFLRLNFGAMAEVGPFAAGFTTDVITSEIEPPSGTASGLDLAIASVRGSLAYAAFDHQLVLGLGVRSVGISVDSTHLSTSGGTVEDSQLFTVQATAPEFGAIVRPNESPWRASVTLRPRATGGITTKSPSVDSAGVQRAGSFIIPSRLTLPAEVELGFAYQLGPRPLNPRFVDLGVEKARLATTLAERRAEREKARALALSRATGPEHPRLERAWSERNAVADDEDLAWVKRETERLARGWEGRRRAARQKVLLLASLLALGTTSGSVAISSFLDQTKETLGHSVTLSPRLGVELEPFDDRLMIEGGSYLEPSRFDNVGPRLHGTLGATVRLFEWSVFGLFPHTSWTISSSADLASRGYFDWGLSLGTWD